MRKSSLSKPQFLRPVLTAAALLGLAACSQNADPEAGQVVTQPVEMASIQPQTTYAIRRDFAGLVVPAQSTDLGFELAGKVSMLTADEGETVQAGERLAMLDTDLLLDRRRELSAQLEEIVANIELNRLNNKRIVELESKGFASKQRADELATEYDTLNARQAQVEAALTTNQTRIDKSELRAPFDSTVSARFVDAGAVVNAGTPVLRLLESGQAEARVGVPVRMLDSLSVGQSVSLSVAGQATTGQVIALGQNVTRSTLTVPVRVVLSPEAPAVFGDQAYLQLDETIVAEGFWVPLEAITEGMRGLWNVYAARPEADGSAYVIESRDVRVLFAETRRAFVSGALAGDELIVQSGLHRLVPGQRVVRAEASSQLGMTAAGDATTRSGEPG
ncbi:MAG: efflux RND transporter periplasmic adaptor subunit [Pseudomonadota bacterium]